MDATLVTLNQSKSTVNEAYRTLQSNVSFSSVDQTLKTLTLTTQTQSTLLKKELAKQKLVAY